MRSDGPFVRRRIWAGLFLVFFSLFVVSSVAVAGGGDHYPNGAEGFWAGAAPPPGFYVLDYNYFYSATEYKANNGDTINKGPLDDFSLHVYANVLRLLYISKYKLLGGYWGAHVFLPYVDVKASAKGFKGHQRGMGDIIVDPFILSWHFKRVHAVLGLADIYLPTGEYDKHRPVNVGKNFYTIEPVFGVTFMLPYQSTLSFKFMYDINTTNNDWINPATGKETSLTPGQEFHFDYCLEKAFASWLHLGVAGYYYQQTTDDEIDGKDVENNRGKVFAIGPGIKIDYKRFSLISRGFWEMATKNRPEGKGMWLKLVYAF